MFTKQNRPSANLGNLFYFLKSQRFLGHEFLIDGLPKYVLLCTQCINENDTECLGCQYTKLICYIEFQHNPIE